MLRCIAININCGREGSAEDILLARLIELAKLGFAIDPFSGIREFGNNGGTEFNLVVVYKEGNRYKLKNIPWLQMTTRCF